MRGEWELPLTHSKPLSERCRARGIQFSCTPFYIQAVEELRPFVDFYKIASYELLVTPLLEACAKTGKPIVLSTGMATLDEIRPLPRRLQECRRARRDASPLRVRLSDARRRSQSLRDGDIREATGMNVGWSDHTRRPSVIERAVHHWNAAAIEFHLDLDGEGAEYASGHCWLPEEIAPVIARIRESLDADGAGFKGPQPSEIADREWRADPVRRHAPALSVRATWKPAA